MLNWGIEGLKQNAMDPLYVERLMLSIIIEDGHSKGIWNDLKIINSRKE
jgi:hypothetical protein